MELNIRELNELIYCIGIARMHGQLLGTTVADKLEDRLRNELDKRLSWDLSDNLRIDKLKAAAERYSDEVRVKHIHIEEDSFKKVLSSVAEPKKEKGWITQAILDYVETKGSATYKELNDYYRNITGSNSFSHHVYNLITPYKNRPTQRYLVKDVDGKYIIKVANPYNWVIIDDYDEFSNQ